MMTRKNYRDFADALGTVNHYVLKGKITTPEDAVNLMTDILCDIFKSDNPRFDESKFRDVVGIQFSETK